MLIMSKMGILGPDLQKVVSDVDNATLSTLEHTGLFLGVSTMMPQNSTLMRKIGVFLVTSIAYNLVNQRAMSSESSGTGR